VVELLLVIGISAVTLSSIVPLTARYRLSQELESAAQSIVNSGLRPAQLAAMQYKNDSAWGVYFDPVQPRYVVFGHAERSYADPLRDTSLDQVTRLVGDLALSGLGEVVFAKGTGKVTIGGVIVVSNAYGSRTITVGSEGTVEVPPHSAASSSVASEDDVDLSIFAEP
jgi:type II secretory pathway pseudopilin PulG